MFAVLKPLVRGERDAIERQSDAVAAVSQQYVLLCLLSCVIATFGLVVNSAAVIIGAMLVAPLMGPILAAALALIRGDAPRFGRAAVTVLIGALLALGISTGLGHLVSGGTFNFLEVLPPEVLSRTQPTLFDLVIALAGGAAGTYALCNQGAAGALPGVAIATALMPPLCTAGIGISQGRTDVRDGALLLFAANLLAIVFASVVMFAFLGFRPVTQKRSRLVLSGSVAMTAMLVVAITIPLVGFMTRIIANAQENATIRSVLTQQLHTVSDDSALVDFEKQYEPKGLRIIATVRVPNTVTYSLAATAQEELAAQLDRTIALTVLVVPITRLEPVTPPPRTPTPKATATRTATPQATRTPTSTTSPTPARSPTPSTTATLTPGAPRSPTPDSGPASPVSQTAAATPGVTAPAGTRVSTATPPP